MKIIYTIHQFFPKHYTGTERYLLNLAKMMKKFGHEVKVVTYMPVSDGEEDTIRKGNLLLKEYVYENIPVTAIRYTGNEDYISFDFDNPDIQTFFEEYLEKEKPDVIHITHLMRMTSAFFAAEKLGIKIVMTLTDYWVMCGKGILIRNNNSPCMSPKEGQNCKKFCYQHLTSDRLKKRVDQGRYMFKKAHALIASAYFLANLFKLNGYDMSKLNMIRHSYNYFDGYKPIPKIQHKTFTFSSVGSLLPHKGADILIEAFHNLKASNARLKIYGEAYDQSYFEFLKGLAKGDKRITFEGKYTMAETYNIHKETDVIVQPSTWYETYPLVGVAALAYGVPLIVPDTTGSSELVTHGENGYIFKFADSVSLYEMMEKAYNDNLKLHKTISYPHSVEEEAYLTQEVYYKVVNS